MSLPPQSNSPQRRDRESTRPVYTHVEDSIESPSAPVPAPQPPKVGEENEKPQKPPKRKRRFVTLLAVLALIAVPVTMWLRDDSLPFVQPESELSEAWLNGPATVRQLDGAARMLSVGERYLVMHWQGMPRVWDMKKVAQLFESIDFRDRQYTVDEGDGAGRLTLGTEGAEMPDPSRLTQVDNTELVDTNYRSAAIYHLDYPSWWGSDLERWSASEDFYEATADPSLQWQGPVAYSPLDDASGEFTTQLFNTESGEREGHCTFAQYRVTNTPVQKPVLHSLPGQALALVADRGAYLRVLDLVECDDQMLSMDELSISAAPATNDGALPLLLRRVVPVSDGWWLSGLIPGEDSFQSLHITIDGQITPGETFPLDTAISVQPNQEFSFTDLDTAYGCIQPGDKGVYVRKVDDRLQTSVAASDGRYREYLDGVRVPWLTGKAIYLSDFDHAAIVKDGEVQLIGRRETGPLWQVPGTEAYFVGGHLVVNNATDGHVAIYKPGS